MNLHDRIEAYLTRREGDQIPFTIYWDMIPKSEAERRLRNKGLGYWWQRNVLRWEYPNCDVRVVRFSEGGEEFARTVWSTPKGEISGCERLGGLYGSSWQTEWPIKSKDDYRVMDFVARDARPVPLYEEFRKTQKTLAGDGFVIGQYNYTPLMALIVRFVGFEQAAYHMIDYPDQFWSLYESLNDRNRRGYGVLAKGPQLLNLYGGNCHPHILGRERFRDCVVPCYDELADCLHEEGKLLGVHFDADNKLWKDIIGASKVDLVEAFTPPPDCDLPLDEAREAWPDKLISINFPSSIHLAPREKITEAALDLLRQAGDGRAIHFGITEDVPEDRWPESLDAIADALNEYGRLPLSL